MAALNRFLRLQPLSSSLSSLRCFTALASEARLGFPDSLSHHRPLRRPNHANRNVQWVFLGSPGVGKGTYASRLSQLLGVPHIATGDLVRAELKSSSPLADQQLILYQVPYYADRHSNRKERSNRKEDQNFIKEREIFSTRHNYALYYFA